MYLIQKRGWQTSSVKRQMVNISDFGGHKLSVATTQLRCCRMKEVTDNMHTNDMAVCQQNFIHGNCKFKFHVILCVMRAYPSIVCQPLQNVKPFLVLRPHKNRCQAIAGQPLIYYVILLRTNQKQVNLHFNSAH